MKIYKIRNNVTGLYSLGSRSPSWGKKGKIWTSNNGLSNHFNLVGYDQVPSVYRDCEIVEYELVETEVASSSVIDWSRAAQERSKKAELLERKKILERQAAHAQKQVEKVMNSLQLLVSKK